MGWNSPWTGSTTQAPRAPAATMGTGVIEAAGAAMRRASLAASLTLALRKTLGQSGLMSFCSAGLKTSCQLTCELDAVFRPWMLMNLAALSTVRFV
jgi:hypothetical protein